MLVLTFEYLVGWLSQRQGLAQAALPCGERIPIFNPSKYFHGRENAFRSAAPTGGMTLPLTPLPF